MRRLQHRLDDELGAGGEIRLLLKEGLVAAAISAAVERTAEGLQAEAADELRAARRARAGRSTGLCVLPVRKAVRASFSAAAL